MQLTKKYFSNYNEKSGKTIDDLIANFDFKNNADNFSYLTKASAVYSSNIEGNTIDLNSFMNYEMNKQFKKIKEITEIENLIRAYEFAQNNNLNEQNLLKTHKIFAETLVNIPGKYRTEKVGVFSESGLVYLAIEPEFVENEMQKFFAEITELLKLKLTASETFYYASLIHLRFAHIHPFPDGNGRAARLLEKWFIAKKLGKKFWLINSEKYYKENQNKYYQNINLGVNFYELNYDNCINFLEMLPNSVRRQ